ncbi:hypothetical protein GQ43DRAFT_463538 [Delitschia confertaspora ATCC 74209]|uniref:DUF155 domain-containing protein n=1 Tax=Delitschia confertaspora ATCC 74209 TaxID=1513339 RepID=A0A9P4JPN9_9PLEO|nr:hypothetical protein GQ43DRAFT_463538 [Delitschia confertaspora ATCC 74209]
MNPLRQNAITCLFRSCQLGTQASTIRSQSRPPAFQQQRKYLTRPFSSARSGQKKVDFQQNEEQKGKEEVESNFKKGPPQISERKLSRTATKPTSLRRVAAEAQRSRGLIKGKGSKRFVDPDVDTKTVTAYCAAEQYKIPAAARLIRAQGYELDPYQTGLYPQVIHVQTTERPSEVRNLKGRGDIFIFPSGTVVTWNVRESEALNLINRILPECAEGSHLESIETEDLEYLEDPSRESSEVVGDTIVLGTKVEPAQNLDSHPHSRESNQNRSSSLIIEDNTEQRHEVDTVLAKIAFSSGLARSTKLAILESLLSAYQHSTRSIPTMLAKGKSMPFGKSLPVTRSFILRKTGELLSIRAQLNLYSELTDSLPDIFWDSRHELGLGEYYDQVGRALDVGVRIKVLNEKIGFAQEIASVLRESLSEKHGLRLEWAIIALIAVEVVLEFYRHWKEVQERDDPGSTETLLRRYLEKLEKEGA